MKVVIIIRFSTGHPHEGSSVKGPNYISISHLLSITVALFRL